MREINSLLRKVKLIENFNIETPLLTTDLVKRMDIILHKDKSSFFVGDYSSKSQFVGNVDVEGFEIRKSLINLGSDKVLVKAFGSFLDLKDKTKVNIEIIGFDPFMKFFYGGLSFFLILILSAFLLSIFNSDFKNNIPNPEYAFLINLLLLIILFLYTYYLMRKSMKNMRHDLERELHYLTKE